ncbi:MAG: hypothetical protein ACRDAU_04150 [Clostridium sp.]
MKSILQSPVMILTIILFIGSIFLETEGSYFIQGSLLIVFIISVYYVRKEYLNDKDQ